MRYMSITRAIALAQGRYGLADADDIPAGSDADNDWDWAKRSVDEVGEADDFGRVNDGERGAEQQQLFVVQPGVQYFGPVVADAPGSDQVLHRRFW